MTLISTLDMTYWIVLGTVATAAVAGIGYMIMVLSTFKHRIIIKEIIHNRKIIHFNRFKEWTDPDGVCFFKLLKGKKGEKLLPKAPEEAIETDEKGKKVIQAYRLSTGEVIYCTDNAQPVPQDIVTIEDNKKRDEKLKEWLKTNTAVEAYKPLTTPQRLILIDQIKKAMSRKKKTWHEYIMPVAGLLAMLILVVSLLIFYENIAAPCLAMADKQIHWENIQKEELQIIQQMKQDIQTIKEEKLATPGNARPVTPPN